MGRKFELSIDDKKKIIQVLLIVSAIISAFKIPDEIIWIFMLFILFSLIYYVFLFSDKIRENIQTMNFITVFVSSLFSLNFTLIFTISYIKYVKGDLISAYLIAYTYYFGLTYIMYKILSFKGEEGNKMKIIKKTLEKNKDIITISIVIIVIILILYLNKDFIFTQYPNLNLFFYVALPIIFAILSPFIKDWVSYRFSKPKFKIHFKPTIGTTYKEEPVQEIILLPNKQQLIWVMIHNNGKVIKDNWFVNVDFTDDFVPISIDETEFKDVDFKKKYTIQKEKYQVAHFNSNDFSPLFPYDETFIFPIVLKTPKTENEYDVSVAVRTGNHREKYTHSLKIKIEKL